MKKLTFRIFELLGQGNDERLIHSGDGLTLETYLRLQSAAELEPLITDEEFLGQG